MVALQNLISQVDIIEDPRDNSGWKDLIRNPGIFARCAQGTQTVACLYGQGTFPSPDEPFPIPSLMVFLWEK